MASPRPEIAALRRDVEVLESTVAALRRELLIEKRRVQAARDEQRRIDDVRTSRAYRLCQAYYALYGIPLFGALLHATRRLAARMHRAVRR